MNIHVPGMTLRAALARQSHQTLLPWQTTIYSQSYSSSMPTTMREREREKISKHVFPTALSTYRQGLLEHMEEDGSVHATVIHQALMTVGV